MIQLAIRRVVRLETTRSGALAQSVIAALIALVFIFLKFLPALTSWAQNEKLMYALVILTLLWVTLILYIPLAVVMGMLGLFTAIFNLGLDPAFSMFGNEAMQFLTNYSVAVLPMFLMMGDRKSTRLNSSHVSESRMPSSA